jgi:hypothetical protein
LEYCSMQLMAVGWCFICSYCLHHQGSHCPTRLHRTISQKAVCYLCISYVVSWYEWLNKWWTVNSPGTVICCASRSVFCPLAVLHLEWSVKLCLVRLCDSYLFVKCDSCSSHGNFRVNKCHKWVELDIRDSKSIFHWNCWTQCRAGVDGVPGWAILRIERFSVQVIVAFCFSFRDLFW